MRGNGAGKDGPSLGRVGRTIVGVVIPGWVLLGILTAMRPPKDVLEYTASAAAFWLALAVFWTNLTHVYFIDRLGNAVVARINTWLAQPWVQKFFPFVLLLLGIAFAVKFW